jgi:hypothetical protein
MENMDDEVLIEIGEMAEMRRSWADASHSST